MLGLGAAYHGFGARLLLLAVIIVAPAANERDGVCEGLLFVIV